MSGTKLNFSDLEGASSFSRITIAKEKLLAALVENKKDHDEIFANALEGYYEHMREELQKKLDLIPIVKEEFLAALESINPESGKAVDLTFKNQYNLFNIAVPFPVSHEEDYKRAIRMVDFSASNLFKLSETEFAQYVMNDWEWKEQFVTTNSLYLSNSATRATMKKFAG